MVPAPHSMDPLGEQEPLAELGVPTDATDFYLCLSRLLAYKNVDTTIEAIARDPRRRLIVVGSGPEEARLKRDLPANVTLVKNLSEAQLRWLYARCRAVVSASHEDFGLTPLEGAAFGKPSVVLRWGGFLDTIQEGVTGEYFDEVTADSITAALRSLRVAHLGCRGHPRPRPPVLGGRIRATRSRRSSPPPARMPSGAAG